MEQNRSRRVEKREGRRRKGEEMERGIEERKRSEVVRRLSK